ncbi:hypothetical protein DAEQUDRAFT_441909 [Daedalea quercina L-15889]|uniref:Uncharacterized protein n=1 Tax=Daedalea quercina L-15889 TaxID=1314783 RepID=A0A165N8Y4_9APHY|nr:hypothetical protein DAEQUDRAFT_441909 [Daedalea quercina L-15889]
MTLVPSLLHLPPRIDLPEQRGVMQRRKSSLKISYSSGGAGTPCPVRTLRCFSCRDRSRRAGRA